ncbi:MAG: hypothetical protein Q9221_003656 [Calogaya cf. arnoldii]
MSFNTATHGPNSYDPYVTSVSGTGLKNRTKAFPAARSRPHPHDLRPSAMEQQWEDFSSNTTASFEPMVREQRGTPKRRKKECPNTFDMSWFESVLASNLRTVREDAKFPMDTYLTAKSSVPDIRIWLSEDFPDGRSELGDVGRRGMIWRGEVGGKLEDSNGLVDLGDILVVPRDEYDQDLWQAWAVNASPQGRTDPIFSHHKKRKVDEYSDW